MQTQWCIAMAMAMDLKTVSKCITFSVHLQFTDNLKLWRMVLWLVVQVPSGEDPVQPDSCQNPQHIRQPPGQAWRGHRGRSSSSSSIISSYSGQEWWSNAQTHPAFPGRRPSSPTGLRAGLSDPGEEARGRGWWSGDGDGTQGDDPPATRRPAEDEAHRRRATASTGQTQPQTSLADLRSQPACTTHPAVSTPVNRQTGR